MGTDGGGNLDQDPLFVSPITENAPTTTGDLRLRDDSPAIDAGNDDVTDPALPVTDLDGRARIFGAKVDLGPYESVHEEPAVVDPPVSLSTAARLTLSGARHFGATELGGRSRVRRMVVRNVANQTLTNLVVRIAGGGRQFSASAPAERVLAPGGGTTVRVVFRPRVEGRSKAVLSVSGPGVAKVSLPLSGVGRSLTPKQVRPQTPLRPRQLDGLLP